MNFLFFFKLSIVNNLSIAIARVMPELDAHHWQEMTYWNKIDFKTCKIALVKAQRKGTAGTGRDESKTRKRMQEMIAPR